jgi:hypothetical protein
MGEAKAAPVLFLKQEMQRRGEDLTAELMKRLAPEDAQAFEAALAVSWFPIEVITRIITTGVPLLYPGDRTGLRKFGFELAQDNLTGLYKVLVRMTTVPFLIAQVAKLWNNYHRQGKTWAGHDLNARTAFMVVGEYPELTEGYREHLTGYVHGALSLTRVENVQVTHDARDANAWRWDAEWS